MGYDLFLKAVFKFLELKHILRNRAQSQNRHQLRPLNNDEIYIIPTPGISDRDIVRKQQHIGVLGETMYACESA